MFLDERTQYCKEANSLQLMDKFQRKSLAGFSIKFEKKKKKAIQEKKTCRNNKKKF